MFAQEIYNSLELIAKNKGSIYLFSESKHPNDYDDIRTFIYGRCEEYQKVMSPKNQNVNILVDINSGMWTEYDIVGCLNDNFKGASLFVVDYVYGFDIDLPDYDDRWREIRYSFIEIEDNGFDSPDCGDCK